MTETDDEAAKFYNAISKYYDLIGEMEEKGFHLEDAKLLDKASKITFFANEIKFALSKEILEKVSELEIEVTSLDVADMCFAQTHISFTLPLRDGDKNE